MTPHAAKALNKKLWYLKDQATAGTTSPADHQTGPQKAVTILKRHLPHPAVRCQPTRQIGTNRPLKKAQNVQAIKNQLHQAGGYLRHPKENLMQAKVMAILKAALPAAKRKAFHHANHIQAALQIAIGPKKSFAW